MKKWKVYSPSYKRGNLAISHKLFRPENFCYVVKESDSKNYTHLGVEILKIPDEKDGSIAKARNWILENKTTEYLIMVDDDLSSVVWTLKRNRIKQTIDEIESHIENGFQLAEDCNAGIWGLNVQNDPMFYRISTPFSFNSPVLGPFLCILDSTLRFDENLPLKEDYDFFIQQLRKHRKVLRLNYLHYNADHQNFEGGCKEYRNITISENQQKEALIKKWGTDVVDYNPRNPDLVNLVVKKFL